MNKQVIIFCLIITLGYIGNTFSQELTATDSGTFIEEEKDGLWRSYYGNGNIYMEVQQKLVGNKYKFHGLYRSFYKSGNIEEEGCYLNDKKNGLWRYYAEDGSVKQYDVYFGKKKYQTIYYFKFPPCKQDCSNVPVKK